MLLEGKIFRKLSKTGGVGSKNVCFWTNYSKLDMNQIQLTGCGVLVYGWTYTKEKSMLIWSQGTCGQKRNHTFVSFKNVVKS